jgi:flagellar protein FlaF
VNAIKQARRAYSAANASTRSARSIEYEVIARITTRIRNAAQKGRRGFPELVEALYDNKRLWTVFMVDIAEPTNPLPADLKARLFGLAEFTLRHSSLVLSREATVDPLLDINSAIMSGLRKGAS